MRIKRTFSWIAAAGGVLAVVLVASVLAQPSPPNPPYPPPGEGVEYMEACEAIPTWTSSDYVQLFMKYRNSDTGWIAGTCLGRCGDPGYYGVCSCDPATCCEQGTCCEDIGYQCIAALSEDVEDTCGDGVVDEDEECDLGEDNCEYSAPWCPY